MKKKTTLKPSRRDFLKASVASLPAMNARPWDAGPPAVTLSPGAEPIQWKARWIWFPEGRTLPSTFVFFRKEFSLAGQVESEARAWVSGNSRYMLWINGTFVQRGPAPCDPRYWDVDPVELSPLLHPGKNVVAGLVCHFGGGDGTYVPGTPIGLPATAGFWFQADIPTSQGSLTIATDHSWRVHRARCWPAGNYQRWYLRALQEIFDARKYPYGWNTVEFDDSGWRPAEDLDIPPGRPLLREVPRESWQEDWRLAPRSIPLMQERPVAPKRITNVGRVTWLVPPEEYFDCFPLGAFREEADPGVVLSRGPGGLIPLQIAAPGEKSVVVTFDFEQEVCGYPYVRLRAAAGTVVDILYVETSDPQKLLLRTAPEYGQWVRLTTREGVTEFEAFDWDSFRFLQLAIRSSDQPVDILSVGVTERRYPYKQQPDLKTSDEALNRAVAGTVNTHLITSQDTLMDNIARERQQYAGDVDHAKLTSYYGFGEYRQAARMIKTYSQGQNEEGWFMDCWPAWDRCQRLWQKSLHLTQWGPIIDHGIGFVISTALYYLFSGDRVTIEQVYPRFLRFARWLETSRGSDGLLPATGWIRNSVWMDHRGWKTLEDKKAALNIYYVGFLREGIARLADWLGDRRSAIQARELAAEVAQRVHQDYWSDTHGLFVDNLPRHHRDNELRLHERTLAMALLYDLVPPGHEGRVLNVLVNLPTKSDDPIYHVQTPAAEIGFSFPANAGWRLWALSRLGRGDAVIKDLRERWARMPSLRETGTFSENWVPRLSQSGDVWCQNGPVVLYALYGNVLGIEPTSPGFAEFDVRPQIGDLAWIEGTIHSPRGPIKARCSRGEHGLALSLTVPPEVRAALVMPMGARITGLPSAIVEGRGPALQTRRWKLPVFTQEKVWEFAVDSV